jgi:hypothetical protein
MSDCKSISVSTQVSVVRHMKLFMFGTAGLPRFDWMLAASGGAYIPNDQGLKVSVFIQLTKKSSNFIIESADFQNDL